MRKIVATVVSLVMVFLVTIPVFSEDGYYNHPVLERGAGAPIMQFASQLPTLTSRASVQNIGWMPTVPAGGLTGTVGRHLHMEAFTINLGNIPGAAGQNFIEYRAHVRNVGWQPFVRNGQMAGTTGRNLPIEAVQIRLVGALADQFNIYYQVHVAHVGWLSWTRNGAVAGSTGSAVEIQAMRIRLIPRNGISPGPATRPHFSAPIVRYSAHVQDIGWQSVVQNSATAGTVGRNLRMEAVRISLTDTGLSGNIEYRAYVQNSGWQRFVSNNAVAGTTGRRLGMEAIQIRLTGEVAQVFEVYYRVNILGHGWLDWAKNGQSAGSMGISSRIEALEVRLVSRGGGGNRPRNTHVPFLSRAAGSGRRGLQRLDTELRNMISRFPGRQSIYVKNLNTGEYLLINNDARYNPASLMKLFVVGAAQERIARGQMTMTPQIRRWMDETITISTNDSYNWLLFHIGEGDVIRGLNRVTDFSRRQGYTQTVGGHSFGVHPQPSRIAVPGGNRTSVRDVGWFLVDVYRGGLVNRNASSQIMSSLLRQQRLNKIPAGLPRGVRSGSKTGEWAGYEHDAAIVFSNGATYVIVIKASPGANSIQNIRTISRHVFNFFN